MYEILMVLRDDSGSAVFVVAAVCGQCRVFVSIVIVFKASIVSRSSRLNLHTILAESPQ